MFLVEHDDEIFGAGAYEGRDKTSKDPYWKKICLPMKLYNIQKFRLIFKYVRGYDERINVGIDNITVVSNCNYDISLSEYNSNPTFYQHNDWRAVVKTQDTTPFTFVRYSSEVIGVGGVYLTKIPFPTTITSFRAAIYETEKNCISFKVIIRTLDGQSNAISPDIDLYIRGKKQVFRNPYVQIRIRTQCRKEIIKHYTNVDVPFYYVQLIASVKQIGHVKLLKLYDFHMSTYSKCPVESVKSSPPLIGLNHPSCGKTDNTEIIWEKDNITLTNNFPWLVTISVSYNRCAGILIHERFVLSSATCVKKFRQKELKVFYGPERSSGKSIGIVIKTSIHPKYEKNPADYDIALLKLEIRHYSTTYGENLYMLFPKKMEIVNPNNCSPALKIKPPNTLCGEGVLSKNDQTAGTPLNCNINSRPTVTAFTSSPENCKAENTALTQIGPNFQWIKETVERDQHCVD
ncbi:DgyrCDS14837 [Dimorphilus gyrociliatus]|uniref:DgyrCDS14837 n=1 Tax=Dimorphilus gyrociliatus TaxID=2664684 RepID=A0A7I8WF37_9ANNE|nr:DgyrCDS14837 [Dimorphilus gyrociliatus]